MFCVPCEPWLDGAGRASGSTQPSPDRLGDSAVATGIEARVRLLNHSINAAAFEGQVLTLELYDGRQIIGFISEDGARLVRTGALA